MTNIPSNLKYTETDEWFDPATGKIGLSDYAQSQLSDIVFVEILVEPGDAVEPGKAIASVESVKASAEVYAPSAEKSWPSMATCPASPNPSTATPTARLDDQGRGRQRRRHEGRRCLREVLRRAGALIQSIHRWRNPGATHDLYPPLTQGTGCDARDDRRQDPDRSLRRRPGRVPLPQAGPSPRADGNGSRR